jgi:uncharacterized protein (DUF433 family)
MDQFDRISLDPNVMGGKACIKNTRVTVGMIMMQLSEGVSMELLLQEYPYLTRDDVNEALRYASLMVGGREISLAAA